MRMKANPVGDGFEGGCQPRGQLCTGDSLSSERAMLGFLCGEQAVLGSPHLLSEERAGVMSSGSMELRHTLPSLSYPQVGQLHSASTKPR